MIRYSIIILVTICINIYGYAQSGSSLFNNSIVHEIRLESPNLNIYQELYNNHSNYLGGGAKIYTPIKITIDGNVLVDSVGVRFKGETSFTEVQTDKKPIKIDFNKIEKNQKYDDLKKINLHNARSDASMIREYLCYGIFNDMSVAAPRVSFTKVYINNVYWGLYSIVEQIDKTFLKSRFGDKDGNLYKSPSSGSADFDNMELKTNKTANDRSGINHLINIIQNTPNPQFEDSLKKYMNINSFINALAVDVVTLDVDTYWQAGKNYYLYDNPSNGKFEFIPWDYNLSMNYILDGSSLDPDYKEFVTNPIFSNKVIITKILANTNLKNMYLEALCQTQAYFNTTSLFTKIDAIKILIENDVTSDTKKPYSTAEFLDNIAFNSFTEYSLPNPIPGVKQFITDRSVALQNEMTSLNVNCALSIKETNKENPVVYPNPVRKGKYLYLNSFNSVIPYELIQISGKSVMSGLITNGLIEIPSNLDSGYYILKLDSENIKVLIH